jgi:hypothetical protein
MKKIILISLICLVSTQILKSQVTVGSFNEPVKAALLDLKTKNADTNNVTVENNGRGGLVLPRVKLVDKTTLEPFISKTSDDWKKKESEMKKLHIGMMVYNLETGKGFSPGIYVWEASGWVKNEVNATNGLTIANDSIKLGGTLNSNTTIIQKKHSIAFEGGSTAAENGKIYLHNVKNNVPDNTEKIAALGIDDITGELFVMKANNDPATTTKAISYVVYKLKGKGAKVRNFETKIKVKDYTLMIVGSRFSTKTAFGGMKPTADLAAGATPISFVYADEYVRKDTTPAKQDSWVIHADYKDAVPSDGADGTWTIYCLVINNSLIDVHKNAIPYGKNSTTGAPIGNKDITAPNAPAGLK